MKTSWVITYNGNETAIKRAFNDFEDAESTAIKLISERVPNIANIIDDVQSHRHTKIAKKLILCIKEYFCNFSSGKNYNIAELFEDYTLSYDVTDIKENNFFAERDGSCLCFDFGDALRIESNIWEIYGDSVFYNYFYVKTKADEFKIIIEEGEFVDLGNKPTSNANILLIYEVLSSKPMTRKEIQEEIFEISGIELSEATISDHINNLKLIGIPIAHKRSNRYTRGYRSERVHSYEDIDDGYYIDSNLSVMPDYFKCKSSSYPLLLLFLFRDSTVPFPSLNHIVNVLETTYGIQTRRQTVANYIDLLIKFDYDIRHDKKGYWLKR